VRLLVGEDDVVIREFVKRGLSEARFQVNSGEAKTASTLASETGDDGFVIDLGLPGTDGLDLIGKCRAQGQDAPVLISSARRSVDDRVRGLEQGGDEYLPKPFALAELLARVRNLLRRSSPRQSEALRLRVDWVVIDATPMLPMADTTSLSRLSDGVLGVIREAYTRQKVNRTVATIEPSKLLGMVLNEGSVLHSGCDRYYQGYGSSTLSKRATCDGSDRVKVATA